jgi:hypothetical protein
MGGPKPGQPPLPCPPPSTPNSSWNYTEQLTVSASESHDVQMPVVMITGAVLNARQETVPQTSMQANCNGHGDGSTNWSCMASASADANGGYSMFVFTGPSNIALHPPAGAPYTSITANESFTADSTQNFTLPDALFVSGHLYGWNGTPVAGASVQVSIGVQQQMGPGMTYMQWTQIAGAQTANDGSYSVPVQAGVLQLYWSGGAMGCGMGGAEARPAAFALPAALDTELELELHGAAHRLGLGVA